MVGMAPAAGRPRAWAKNEHVRCNANVRFGSQADICSAKHEAGPLQWTSCAAAVSFVGSETAVAILHLCTRAPRGAPFFGSAHRKPAGKTVGFGSHRILPAENCERIVERPSRR